MIRLYVSGEGSNELGSRCDPEKGDEFPDDGFHHGVIEKLAGKVRQGGWEIRHAVRWQDVHKIQVKNPGILRGEAANVERLALQARELACNALVFLRDRDGPKNRGRERVIAKAVQQAKREHKGLDIVGGVPIEMLESWLLALKGDRKSEGVGDPAGELKKRHDVQKKRTTAMVQLVMNSNLKDIPDDAHSLWRWLRSLADTLKVKIPKAWPRPPARSR